MNLGPTELIVILLIILLLFGGAKLPKLAKSLGEAQREFRKGHDDTAEAPKDDKPAANS
jgi:sec-independent protein translocase protein TatA